ncbi:MAG: mannose-1-phosphate guanylyltransferase/mannose-6-phosphate isomerase [Nitrospiraceae bacterium]|nr:mannose-1-phosphate guanylyltransferase/mannose-6-phosphate isomerase [Nitrospiraceae bacterium]
MYAVILAGGSGTRFWPLSRETSPKQMLRVFGDLTMIQQTVARLGDAMPKENIYIVTGQKYAYEIGQQLLEVEGAEGVKILNEPEAKNTAPAIGFAAAHIAKKSPDAVMAVMPSDHIIAKNDVFMEVLRRAKALARRGYLTTIGIKPDRPETGYGYIQTGRSISKDAAMGEFEVTRFVEKPDLKTAKQYMKSGGYLWNSGIFVWRVKDVLAEIRRQLPEFYRGIVAIEKAIGKKTEEEAVASAFRAFKPVSIDYGIMERAKKVAVISADIGWSDMGSLRAIEDISEKDEAGNVVAGNVIDIGSRDSIVYAGKRLVATVGLENMVVVDTPDATLVCRKDNTQDVRKVVDALKKKKADELVEHVTVSRPWGSYTILEVGARYKIKRIVVNAGAKLSYQLHHHRSEHWVVVSGTARVTVGEKSFNVHPNESTYVPMSTGHRLENPGKVPLHLIEVQNGDYMAEDDIVRFDDEYGRTPAEQGEIRRQVKARKRTAKKDTRERERQRGG